ncbi:hypothetical protein [Paenibacillus lutrae]|uniref:Uncharacterized protein n=1 Tax=Paenibacillus lutrae TaxID=2078573 RepID=A0A7X3FKK6_9BACL|nr:hypothetical protein [Paenibacillus lutrae]MVP01204.1 hypothetical protein [Paenibacillus lutrae]
MSFGVIFFILIGIAGIIVLKNIFKRKKRKLLPHRLRNAPPVPALAEPGNASYELAIKLEDAIPMDWANAIKNRVLSEHSGISEREHEWRWLELKRFFMMCAVLKQVPMFSSAVDEIWHEMLMYTQEYQRFSTKFLGQMLHHSPSGEPSKPQPDERAWFDLVYVEMFGWNPYSEAIWGVFFRNPLPREELHLYRNDNLMLQPQSRFNARTYEHLPEARKLIDFLRSSLKYRTNLSVQQFSDKKTKMNDNHTEILLASAVFFSIHNPTNFAEQMAPAESPNRKDGASNCTAASSCSSGGDDYDKSSCSSNSCSGSSCSSSCGSGCGGGD